MKYLKSIRLIPVLYLSALVFFLVSMPSCSRKSGCPAEDAMVQTDKHGNLKKGKAKSGLLPAKGRKISR